MTISSKERRVAVPVVEVIAALEREAGNTDTDPRWLAAQCLRNMDGWERRTLICALCTEPDVTESSAHG